MGEPMTEERWREIRDSQRREYNRMVAEIDPPTWEYDAIQDLAAEAERALAEIDRMRADNEQYRTTLERIERWDNGQCGDWAHDALSPAPTP